MTKSPSPRELIEQYERLRRCLEEVGALMDRLDSELVELEKQLPADYCYPGDPIQAD